MKIVTTKVVASQPPNGDRLQRRPLMPILTPKLSQEKGLYLKNLWLLKLLLFEYS